MLRAGLLVQHRTWWIICLAIGAMVVWSGKDLMCPDCLSYLELGSEAARHGPGELINGYWSPGYPALIGLAFLLFQPAAATEVPIAHVALFTMFVLALAAFTAFLKQWLTVMLRSEPKAPPAPHVIAMAYATFLLAILSHIDLRYPAADLGVAAAVFGAAAVTCRLSLPAAEWRHYLLLGALLALGYYAKAAMFLLGLGLLAILCLLPRSGFDRKKLLASLLMYLAIASPMIAAMSRREGKLSFGEAGPLNYVWYINKLPIWTGWTGNTPIPLGIPRHPPRMLLVKPLTLEFASPVKGTYPLWYDPSYWYAGAKPTFNLAQQLAAFKTVAQDLKKLLLEGLPFVTGALPLLWLALYRREYPRLRPGQWWLLAWPATAVLIYSMVHIEGRFVAAFLVILWLTVYRLLLREVTRGEAAAIYSTVLLAAMIPVSVHIARDGARAVRDAWLGRQPWYQRVGTGLGLQPGDRLAVVGEAFDAYYARFSRARVVAQIPDEAEFWRLSPEELKAATERLAAIGVTAVVARNRPDAAAPAAWRDVAISDALRFSVLALSR